MSEGEGVLTGRRSGGELPGDDVSGSMGVVGEDDDIEIDDDFDIN